MSGTTDVKDVSKDNEETLKAISRLKWWLIIFLVFTVACAIGLGVTIGAYWKEPFLMMLAGKAMFALAVAAGSYTMIDGALGKHHWGLLVAAEKGTRLRIKYHFALSEVICFLFSRANEVYQLKANQVTDAKLADLRRALIEAAFKTAAEGEGHMDPNFARCNITAEALRDVVDAHLRKGTLYGEKGFLFGTDLLSYTHATETKKAG